MTTVERARIRPAISDDVPAVLALIHELARYEREPDAVVATVADLATALFPPDAAPKVFCHVADGPTGIVGAAVWFVNFSTWQGRHGIYVEDLVVTEAARGAGVGRDLLQALADLAVASGYRRLDWAVLDWNTPAIGFYERLGARAMDEWTGYRIDGAALLDLGGGHGTEA